MGRLQSLRDKVGLIDEKLLAGGTSARGHVVAVKVKPGDRANIALDFAADAPHKPKKGLFR